MNQTVVRLLAAAVGLSLILPAIIWATWTVEIVVAIVIVICAHEYSGMAFADDRPVAMAWLLGLIGLVYGSALYRPDALVPALMVATVGTMAFCTLRPRDDLKRAAGDVGRYLAGMAWIGFGLASVSLLRRIEPGGTAYIFLVLTISWLGDTGGYFAGRAFGKTKLYPLVSPKKTWEGVAGGVTLATVGVFVVRALGLPWLHPAECILLGVVLTGAGVTGDLAESLLKRAYEVKDSGNIMPGHGGMLDRIDSVLFVTPLLYAWVQIRGGA